MKKKLLIVWVFISTDAPDTADEGSRDDLEDGVRRAVRVVLQESPTVGFRPAVQAQAADARSLSSHGFDRSVADRGAQLPSSMWGDDSYTRGLGDDYGPTARGSCSDRTSGEEELAR